MESGYGRGSTRFFLPIGHIEILEEEVFFLMEQQSQSYEAVMSMPYSRRRRFADRKESLERKRAALQEAQATRARSRGRVRR